MFHLRTATGLALAAPTPTLTSSASASGGFFIKLYPNQPTFFVRGRALGLPAKRLVLFQIVIRAFSSNPAIPIQFLKGIPSTEQKTENNVSALVGLSRIRGSNSKSFFSGIAQLNPDFDFGSS
jgi:hypothetical protein